MDDASDRDETDDMAEASPPDAARGRAAAEVPTVRHRLPGALAPRRAWTQRVLARTLNLAPPPDAAERRDDARQIMALTRSLERGERLDELLASQAVATHAGAMGSINRGTRHSPDDRTTQGYLRCAAQLFAVGARQNDMLKQRRERADAAAAGTRDAAARAAATRAALLGPEPAGAVAPRATVGITWSTPDWVAKFENGQWKNDPEILAYLRLLAHREPALLRRALAAAPDGAAPDDKAAWQAWSNPDGDGEAGDGEE